MVKITKELKLELVSYEIGFKAIANNGWSISADILDECKNVDGIILGPDPYFDSLYAKAAKHTYMSCERVVATDQLFTESTYQSESIARLHVHGVIEAPKGASFTECPPDYGRDEDLQRLYAKGAKDEASWAAFEARFFGSEK